MSAIISVHSFRGGTGKSGTTANITALPAAEGRRVGVVDTDIQSPGIHVLFGLDEEQMLHSLNDYLWGKCDIKQTAHDVTPKLGPGNQGKVFLIPSSIKAGDIARVLREGYDVGLLNDGLHDLIRELKQRPAEWPTGQRPGGGAGRGGALRRGAHLSGGQDRLRSVLVGRVDASADWKRRYQLAGIRAVVRSGTMRSGHAFFGSLVYDSLGPVAASVLTASVVINAVLILLVYYAGVATTLAGATGLPAPAWAALMLAAHLYFVRRESLNATVASALVVGAANLGLLLVLSALALPRVQAGNLLRAGFGSTLGQAFDTSVLPLVAIFGVAEWLLWNGQAAFATPLAFVGAVTVPLMSAVFPMLLLAASRRRGEYLPGIVIRGLGWPGFVGLVCVLFLASIFFPGLVIWHQPIPRAAASLVGVAVLGSIAICIGRGSFKLREIVEVCDDRTDGRALFRVVADGRPFSADVWLRYVGGEDHLHAPTGAISTVADLRSILFRLRGTVAREPKIWVHQITPEGDSLGLAAKVEVGSGPDGYRGGIALAGGEAVIGITGAACEVEMALARRRTRA